MTPAKIIKVKVLPNAHKNEICGWLDKDTLKVRLTAPPVEGKANEALVKFLAGEFNIKKKQVRIIKGQTSKLKIVAIKGNISFKSIAQLF